MKKTGMLEHVIDKYRLTRPLPAYDRERILRSKRKTLSKIVKSEIYDSVLVSPALFFDQFLNRIGMKTTPARGARAFAAAAVFSILLIITLSLTVFYDYGRETRPIAGVPETRKGFVLLAEGMVKIMRNNREIREMGTKERIVSGDVITTSAESKFLFQMEKSLVRLMPLSSVSVDMGLKIKSILLRKGTVLCRVKHLEGNETFRIMTPNAGIVVTGTGFSVTCNKKITSVTVSEGTVKATNLVNKNEVPVREGESVVISGTSIVKKPEKTGSERMELLLRFGKLEYMENINNREARELRKAVMSAMKKMNENAGEKKRNGGETYDKIREKYGRLEEVRLYNGQILTGAIISRGRFFTIVTTGGVKRVNSKNVKDVRIIK